MVIYKFQEHCKLFPLKNEICFAKVESNLSVIKIKQLFFAPRSQAPPGNALHEALPPFIPWQSHKNCITRQSLLTREGKVPRRISYAGAWRQELVCSILVTLISNRADQTNLTQICAPTLGSYFVHGP